MIALIIIGLIIFINIVGFIITKIVSRNELQNIKPCGKFVDVNGKRMHIYARGDEGNGKDTIVLLPGLNVILPSVDFKPLMDELSENYNIVIVEYFGYGFSDKTNAPRTNGNYVEEIRKSLASAGFNPPYVLMPYSASGIYAEYYATKYPQEVKALVLLDTTSSAEKDTFTPPRFVFGIQKLQQSTGLPRIMNPLVLPKTVGFTVENGYTKQEIKDLVTFANYAVNNTIVEQNVQFPANVLEVMEMKLPADMPVLAIKADVYSKGKMHQYLERHLEKLGEHAEHKIIAGSNHTNIYHDLKYRKLVCEAVDTFLNTAV